MIQDSKTLKKEIRNWEKAFYESNARKATKEDVKANEEVALLYKEYAKLKKLEVSIIKSRPFDQEEEEKVEIVEETKEIKRESALERIQRIERIRKKERFDGRIFEGGNEVFKPNISVIPKTEVKERKGNFTTTEMNKQELISPQIETETYRQLMQRKKEIEEKEKQKLKRNNSAVEKLAVEDVLLSDANPNSSTTASAKSFAENTESNKRPQMVASLSSFESEKSNSSQKIDPEVSNEENKNKDENDIEEVELPPPSKSQPTQRDDSATKMNKESLDIEPKKERDEIQGPSAISIPSQAAKPPTEHKQDDGASLKGLHDRESTQMETPQIEQQETIIATLADPFARIPGSSVLRCKLYRYRTKLDKSHPTFFLFNETDNRFLLAARKKRKSQTPHYILSTTQDDLSKDSSGYVGKLRGNFQGTQFVLVDTRTYQENKNKSQMKELAAVHYLKNSFPREMCIGLMGVNTPEKTSVAISESTKSRDNHLLIYLKNKSPRWNEITQTHCLNFGGRVTVPSIKNFQLIMENDEKHIVLQFGRIADEIFTMDVRYPMRTVEAFAVALSTFDAYDRA